MEQRHEIVDLKLMDRIDSHEVIAAGRRTSRSGLRSLLPTSRRTVSLSPAGDDSRGAHNVEYARHEAEQKEYNEPPRRDAEQAIYEPAKTGPNQHATNEFAGEPKAPGVAGCSRCPIHTGVVGRLLRIFARKTFTETLESRGESGLIGSCLSAVAILARAVAHRLDTRGMAVNADRPPAEATRTILIGFRQVKKRSPFLMH